MIRKSFKFKLKPTQGQSAQIEQWLTICREFYNACLQERTEAWQKNKISISKHSQTTALPIIKKDRPDVAELYAGVLINVAWHRVDKAFQNFFRRVKRGETPGYPRFQNRQRYSSFTYPSIVLKADTKHVVLPKLGKFRWYAYEDLSALAGLEVKTLTVKREADGYYAVLSCQLPTPTALPKTGKAVGIDVGLKSLVTTDSGDIHGDLRPLKAAESKLRHLQRKLSKAKRGSKRRHKAKRVIAKRNQKLQRQRKHQLDTISRKLVVENDLIATEDLNVKGLVSLGNNSKTSKGIRRNLHHAAFGQLLEMIDYKAEWAGRQHIKVDPRGTTQNCSGCDNVVPKTLHDRIHACSKCGLTLDRDVNAARNVLKRALQAQRREIPEVGELNDPWNLGCHLTG